MASAAPPPAQPGQPPADPDRQALDRLFSATYEELRRLAATRTPRRSRRQR